MSNRTNRLVLFLIGGALLIGGGLAACFAAGVFGSNRADRDVFDPTLIGWWNEGGWKSFAAVVAIGVVAMVFGLRMIVGQLLVSHGSSRASDIVFEAPETGRGETTLRVSALNHSLERDLKAIPDVHGAKVQLHGSYPRLEVRAVLDVGDMISLADLPDRVDEAIDRLHTTTGKRPQPVDITVRFRNETPERQIS
jgi:hypothetical protein